MPLAPTRAFSQPDARSGLKPVLWAPASREFHDQRQRRPQEATSPAQRAAQHRICRSRTRTPLLRCSSSNSSRRSTFRSTFPPTTSPERVRGTPHIEGKAENNGACCSPSISPPACSVWSTCAQNLPTGHDRMPAALVLFAREIVAIGAMAAPPLMLDPVDFVGLYRQNMERQQAAASRRPSRAELQPPAGNIPDRRRRGRRQRLGARRGLPRSRARQAASRAAAADVPTANLMSALSAAGSVATPRSGR